MIASPTDAVRANIGISLVPEDRKTEALSLKLSGMHNASLPVIKRYTRGPLIDGPGETAAVEAIFERVDVDRRALWTRVGAFSGGNQQKIAIAKWLLAESRVLLLFDPNSRNRRRHQERTLSPHPRVRRRRRGGVAPFDRNS